MIFEDFPFLQTPPIKPPPISETQAILPLLAEKYHMRLCNMIYEPSLVSNQPNVKLEIEMDSEQLEKLCAELRKAVLTPFVSDGYPWTVPVSALHKTIQYTSDDYGTGTLTIDNRPCIKCTAEQKENFIRMIEKYCDTCFLGTCEPEDEDDCRKCLERRVRWEIE